MIGEFYLDTVTKTFISGLSGEILNSIKDQIEEHIKTVLESELPVTIAGTVRKESETFTKKMESIEKSLSGISSQIKEVSHSGDEKLSRIIPQLEETTQFTKKESYKEITSYIEKSLGELLKSEADNKKEIKSDLLKLIELFDSRDQEQFSAIKTLIDKELSRITMDLNTSSDTLKKMEERTTSQLSAAFAEINKRMEELGAEKGEGQAAIISGELKELLLKNGTEQQELMKSLIQMTESQVKGFRDTLDSLKGDVKDELLKVDERTSNGLKKPLEGLEQLIAEQLKGFRDGDEGRAEALKNEILSLKVLIEDKNSAQKESYNYALREVITCLSDMIENSSNTIERRIVEAGESGSGNVKEYMHTLKEHITGCFNERDNAEVSHEETQKALLTSITALFHDNEIKKESFIKNVLESEMTTVEESAKTQFNNLAASIGERIEELKTNGLATAEETRALLLNDLAQIKETLANNGSEQTELMESIIEITEKQITGFGESVNRLKSGILEDMTKSVNPLKEPVEELSSLLTDHLNTSKQKEQERTEALKSEADSIKRLIEEEKTNVNESVAATVRDQSAKIIENVNSSYADVKSIIAESGKNNIQAVEDEISGFKKHLDDSIENRINGAFESALNDLREKIETSVEALGIKIVESGESDRGVWKESLSQLEEHIADFFENWNKNSKNQEMRFKEELMTLIELLQKKDESQDATLKSTINELLDSVMKKVEEKSSNELSSEIGDLKSHITEKIEGLLRSAEEEKGVIPEKLTDLKKMAEETGKEWKEAFSTLSSSMEKLISLYSDNEANYAGNLEHFSQSTAEIKKIAEERAESDNREREGLRSTIESNLLTIIDKLGDSGLTTDRKIAGMNDQLSEMLMTIEGSLEGMQKTLARGSDEKESLLSSATNDLKKHMDFKAETQKSFDEKNREFINSGFLDLKQMAQESNKRQNDILNGIFFSVKKMVNAYNSEKDIAERTESKLVNALESLYKHVRRLETEKEDLQRELLSFAGDAFLENKFIELEEELKKSRETANSYLKEKEETEEKYKKLQELWEKSQSA